jgi:hypothetical protein
MLDSILGLLQNFWTWQTPLSFLAGVGAHHLYVKYIRDRKQPLTMTDNPVTNVPRRIWAIVLIAAVIIGWIGWRTQETANRTEQLSRDTLDYAVQTQDCLNQITATLKYRTAFTPALDKLEDMESAALENLVRDVTRINVSSPEDQAALQQSFKRYLDTVAKTRQARTEIASARGDREYPEPACGQDIPK